MKKRQLSRAQRIVMIIGLGFAYDVLGQWMMTIGSRANFGWVAYAPLSNSETSIGGGLHPWVRLVIWMVLIVLWTGTAVLLLREHSTSDGDTPTP